MARIKRPSSRLTIAPGRPLISSKFLQPDQFNGALANLGLSADPLSQNRYSLAGGNPLSFIESDGHRPVPDGGGSADPGPTPDYSSTDLHAHRDDGLVDNTSAQSSVNPGDIGDLLMRAFNQLNPLQQNGQQTQDAIKFVGRNLLPIGDCTAANCRAFDLGKMLGSAINSNGSNGGSSGCVWIVCSGGLGAGGIAGAGLGFAGAQAGIQGTFGLFCGSNEGPHLGGNVSGAAFAYAGGHHVGAPEADSNGNLGAAAGAGASVWFSNAKTAEQLRSNLHAVDLTAGYRIGISVNYQWDDNGTWIYR
jgi:hypothetical protein